MYGVRCPKCAQEFGFIRELQGKQVSCPKCGQVFVMQPPVTSQTAPPPPPRVIVPKPEDVLPPVRSLGSVTGKLLNLIPRRLRIPAAAGVVLLLAFGVFAARLPDGIAPDSSGGRVVYDFQGTGETFTPFFTIRPDWGFDWQVRGSMHDILLANPAVPPDSAGSVAAWWWINVMNSGPGPQSGHINCAKGGQFYLKVNAQGPWRIKVYQYPGRL